MYWTSVEFRSEEVIKTMSHRRFCQITRACCLYSPEEAQRTGESDQSSPNFDSNYKMMPCLRALLLGFHDNYNPSVEMAIDEQIAAFKVKIV